MRTVERTLRGADIALSTSEKNDIKFHVATIIAALVVGSAKPTATQLAATSFETVTDENVATAVQMVLDEISSVRNGDESMDLDRIAKSTDLNERVVQKIADQLAR